MRHGALLLGVRSGSRCALQQADTTAVAASASAPAHMPSLRAASAAVGTGLPTPPTTIPQALRPLRMNALATPSGGATEV